MFAALVCMEPSCSGPSAWLAGRSWLTHRQGRCRYSYFNAQHTFTASVVSRLAGVQVLGDEQEKLCLSWLVEVLVGIHGCMALSCNRPSAWPKNRRDPGNHDCNSALHGFAWVFLGASCRGALGGVRSWRAESR